MEGKGTRRWKGERKDNEGVGGRNQKGGRKGNKNGEGRRGEETFGKGMEEKGRSVNEREKREEIKGWEKLGSRREKKEN